MLGIFLWIPAATKIIVKEIIFLMLKACGLVLWVFSWGASELTAERTQIHGDYIARQIYKDTVLFLMIEYDYKKGAELSAGVLLLLQ